MTPFAYLRADTPEAAASLLAANPGAKLMAGGTTLLDLMKLYVETPPTVIDITRIGLDEIAVKDDGGLTIGALVSNTALAVHPVVRARFPMLSQSILFGASQQIRNMASVGGNLLQRPWCAYFRDTAYPCNKREPGTGCAALHGHGRGNAVLGTSEHCFAAHPTDMGVALAALDAIVRTQRADGTTREIAFVDFHTLPGGTPHIETVLAPDELIVGIDVPATAFASRSKYRKVRDRKSYQHALVSVAAALDLAADGRVREARVALGGVAVKPWRAREAETVLNGAPATEATFRAAAEAAMRDAVPRGDNAFKIELAKRTIARTLADVREMA